MADALMVPMPFDGLRLPADLDGTEGRNRAVGKPAQIAAANDLPAIQAWLARFADTKTTFALTPRPTAALRHTLFLPQRCPSRRTATSTSMALHRVFQRPRCHIHVRDGPQAG